MFYRIIAFTLLVLLASLSSAAEQGPSISELSTTDIRYMAGQRSTLDKLARIELGQQFSGDKNRDLGLLQTLLDREVVDATQKRELQAMGLIMGDHMAIELNMHWVLYEDRIGRSRALRYRDSDSYLFPMTMISRMREADNLMSVADIYRKAVTRIKSSLPAAPYQ